MKDCAKIIKATNVVDTGITIPNAAFVIDTDIVKKDVRCFSAHISTMAYIGLIVFANSL